MATQLFADCHSRTNKIMFLTPYFGNNTNHGLPIIIDKLVANEVNYFSFKKQTEGEDSFKIISF